MPLTRRLVASNPDVTAHGRLTGHERSRLVVSGRDALWLLDARDLSIVHRWALDEHALGTHAVRAGDRKALICGRAAVTMLDGEGAVLWRSEHRPWQSFESGLAWFDAEGRTFALVPGDPLCEVVHLDEADGTRRQRASVATAPSGGEAIVRADGWVGMSIGEGQDGTYAWWVRLAGQDLHVVQAPWEDEILIDDQGDRILTTPHYDGPIRVRSFPQLEVLREIDPRPGGSWDFDACFATADHVVARAFAEQGEVECLVAVGPDGACTTLAQWPDPIVPGPDGSWFATTPNGMERWCLD